MHSAASNILYSLDVVHCFSAACIIVDLLIETKCVYVIHCLLPSYNKVTLSQGLENSGPVSMRASLFKKGNSWKVNWASN